MVKKLILIVIITSPLVIYSQPEKEKKAEKGFIKSTIPVQSQYSNEFKIKNIYFNKRIDWGGKGDVLEVEFKIKNMIDDPQDLYIFIIATYEVEWKGRTSFQTPVPRKERVLSFVPFPFDLKNFEYPDVDKNGNIKKDRKGREMVKLVKFPKNPRAGTDPDTGKPYHLKDNLIIRTTHLSRYRNNYFFFNEVAVLVFNSEGKPAFRQLYELKGYRR
jgi:hypothetical protein